MQQKMKVWSETAEIKTLVFSAVRANMLERDLVEKITCLLYGSVASLPSPSSNI